MFNLKKNPSLPMEELDAMLEEFRKCVPALARRGALNISITSCCVCLAAHGRHLRRFGHACAVGSASPACPPRLRPHSRRIAFLSRHTIAPGNLSFLIPCTHPPLPCRDYNQKHFVRNEGFGEAADAIQGDLRKIFIEFLERSCTAGV